MKIQVCNKNLKKKWPHCEAPGADFHVLTPTHLLAYLNYIMGPNPFRSRICFCFLYFSWLLQKRMLNMVLFNHSKSNAINLDNFLLNGWIKMQTQKMFGFIENCLFPLHSTVKPELEIPRRSLLHYKISVLGIKLCNKTIAVFLTTAWRLPDDCLTTVWQLTKGQIRP